MVGNVKPAQRWKPAFGILRGRGIANGAIIQMILRTEICNQGLFSPLTTRKWRPHSAIYSYSEPRKTPAFARVFGVSGTLSVAVLVGEMEDLEVRQSMDG